MSEIKEAKSLFAGPCTFCPAVHINLCGEDGVTFATGSLPIDECEEFIRQIRRSAKLLRKKYAAPERPQ